ncbi:carbohydrate ABC transporter permease [Pseudolysinimonas sp.]|uniref:carbohydrate ABC transporter permease n=1 Tax=Pseudolysinimonas sp. TaxID=2680009 RepID=UPI003F7E055E
MSTGTVTGVRPGRPDRAPAPASRRRRRRWVPGLLFLAPSLLILGVFVLWPILQSLYYSLFDWTVGADQQTFLGLGNYIALFHDSRFWNALGVTLIYTVASVVLLVVLGFLFALALQGENLLTRIVRSALFFPTIVSLVSIGLVWKFLLDPKIGLLGGLMDMVGLTPVDWLHTPGLALPSVIFVGVWKSVGFSMIIFVGGLKAVPVDRYEAARLDGVSRAQLVRYITIPSIRPTLLFATLILTIQSFQVFDLVYVMTGGGPLFTTDSLVNLLYRSGFVDYKTGYAAAISWVLFAIIMIISALQLRFFRYDDVD